MPIYSDRQHSKIEYSSIGMRSAIAKIARQSFVTRLKPIARRRTIKESLRKHNCEIAYLDVAVDGRPSELKLETGLQSGVAWASFSSIKQATPTPTPVSQAGDPVGSYTAA